MPNKPKPWSIYRNQWSFLPAAPTGDYLKDKVVIVTGATSGVGLEVTKAFAAASPSKLILAVRSTVNGDKVLSDLREKHPGLEGEVVYLDLTQLKSVKEFIGKVDKYGRVDVLVNNAGINPNFDDAPYRATEDGYERTFQTNVLGPVLHTALLFPLLQASSDPKVIFVGSDGHAMADEAPIVAALNKGQSILKAFNTAEGYENGTRYFQSKLLLQMVTRSLIPRLPKMKIINANPGLTRTNLGREFNLGLNLTTLMLLITIVPLMRSPANGAKNITTAVAYGDQSHDYWSECEPTFSENTFLTSGLGMKATSQFYHEILEELEKISPGSTAPLV